MSKLINIIGSPGVGKSTIAAGLFYHLKLRGYTAELVNEYAKEKVWTEDYFTLTNQAYVTIKQYYMQDRSHGKVQCIVTDSPIILGLFYQRKGCTKSFKPYILELFNQYDNLNIMLTMSEGHRDSYSTMGRIHSYEESLKKEKEIIKFLNDNNIPFIPVEVNGVATLNTVVSVSVENLPAPNLKTFE